MDFGAFVNFFGAKDGLCNNTSQLAPHRVNKTSDVVKEGDKVKVSSSAWTSAARCACR